MVHNKVQDEVNMWGKHMCLVEDKREHWTYKCVYEHTHVCSRTWNSFSPHQKNFIFNCSYCSCTIFLTSYLLFTQVLLISILNHVHYLQNYVFYFEKGLNCQMRSSSVSPTWQKKATPSKISHSSTAGDFLSSPLNAIWKPWSVTYPGSF